MGIDLDQEIILTENLDDILKKVDVPLLIEREFALNNNVEFQLLQLQETLSELSLKNEWSKFLPTIAAFGSYQYNAQRGRFNLFDEGKDWFKTTVIGIRMDIPIFNSGAKYFKVQQSRIELKQAQNIKRKAEQGLLLIFSKAKTDLKSAYENYQNIKDNLQLSKEVFDITLEKYREGISSNLDLIQIHNQYLSSQSEYFKVMSDLLNAKNTLDRLLDNY